MTNVRHRIFLNYRRDDTRGAGSQLYDRCASLAPRSNP